MRLKIIFRNFAKFKKNLMYFYLVSSFVFIPTLWGGPNAILKDYQKAMSLSKRTGKPILLYFSADWCPGCHWFSEQLTSDDALRKTAGRVVLLERNCTDGYDGPFMDYCNKTGFPTFMLLNPDQTAGYTWVGTQIDKFIFNVEKFLEGGSPVQAKIETYRANPSAENAIAVAEIYNQQGDEVHAIEYLEKAMAKDPNGQTWLEILRCRDRMAFEGNYAPQKLREDYTEALNAWPLSDDERVFIIGRIYWNSLEDERPQIMAPYWTILRSIDPDELGESQRKIYNFQLTLFDIAQGREDIAIARRKSQLQKGWQTSFKESSEFIYWCLFHRLNLVQALAVTENLGRLAKSEEDLERANQLHVLALFHNGYQHQAWQRYDQMQKAGWQDRPREITDFVLWAWNHKVALEQAEEFGEKLILDLKDPEIRRWVYYYLPKIQNALGHEGRAVETLDKGLEEFNNDQLFKYSRNYYLQKMLRD